MSDTARISYFSMEVGLDAVLPTYSGGLGVLAGDTLKAAADLGLPLVGVTLLHRAGYFHQTLDAEGRQREQPVRWSPAEQLRLTPARASVSIEGREVRLQAWRRDVIGAGGHVVPVLFLDADVEGNAAADRRLTDQLYGGDQRYRLSQEVILGIGGIRVLRSLGFGTLKTYHMNEGHAALLTAELLRETSLATGVAIDSEAAAKAVRSQCVFTTHTPLAAGHDRFPLDLVREVAGEGQVISRSPLFVKDGLFDTTHTALSLSRFANAVSKRHAEVSRQMFPGSPIDWVTNGVHAGTWVATPIARLLDDACRGWRANTDQLAGAEKISDESLMAAHDACKETLLRRVNHDTNAGLSRTALTIGVARRCTPYKRLDLILSDWSRLVRIADAHGPIQILFAGKTHPRDDAGKDMLQRLEHAGRVMPDNVRAVFLPGYDMDLGAQMVAGCDVWLNVPKRPLEASGTSGMKAAMNGVPSLSVLDGWWLEGCREGVTGWAVGEDHPPRDWDDEWHADADALYHTLERKIAPLYFGDRPGWAKVMRSSIAMNGPKFSTHRMMREYASRAYGVG